LKPAKSLPAVTVREYTASDGERVTLALDDGSRVVLAPGSRIRVPAPFAAESRDVWLDGRAYFQVAHDPSHPFAVHSAGAVARVLGTEFDVRAYPDAGPIQVVVRSGRVAVRAESSPESEARVLVRGDRGVVQADGEVRVESGSNVDDLLGWTQGTLAFHGTPLGEAVPELNRWFDVRIRIDDPRLNGRRITATFRDESLDLVLTTVAELVEAQVRRTGKDVVFTSSRTH
jgi:transmembrane sensor